MNRPRIRGGKEIPKIIKRYNKELNPSGQEIPQSIISSADISRLIRERWGESIIYNNDEIREAQTIYNRYQSQLVSYDNDMRDIWEHSNNTSDATNRFQGILNRMPNNHQTRWNWELI